jgi:hypothetical protein
MTRRQLSVLALLLIVPMIAEAQRSSRGRRSRGFAGDSGKADFSQSQSLTKDLQKANPLEALLGKKKDLKLSPEEEKELKALNDALKDEVKPFFKTIDSVQKESRKPGEYAPTQGQLLIGRHLTSACADSIIARYDVAADSAVAKLAADRRQAAVELLEKEEKEREAQAQKARPPV